MCFHCSEWESTHLAVSIAYMDCKESDCACASTYLPQRTLNITGPNRGHYDMVDYYTTLVLTVVK